MKNLEDENGPGIMREILWYLSLLVAFILFAVYWINYVEISIFLKQLEPFFPKIAALLITLFIVNIFLKISIPIIKKAVSLHFKREEWKIIRMIYTYFVWFIAFIIILSGLFGNISSLGLSLSLIGAGLTFALQQVILSFAGWFLIIIKRPYKIGDRIYVKGKDIFGDVEDITMMFTVLKEVAPNDTVTGRNAIIPNSTVFLEPIINYSYDVPYIWISIPISVTYESDLGLAEKIIFNVAKEVAGEDMRNAARTIRRRTPESVQVELASEEPIIRLEFADSSLIVRVRIMCLPKQVPAIRTEIFRRVFQEFNKPENKDKVEIAYPHMELVVHDEVMGERMKSFFDR